MKTILGEQCVLHVSSGVDGHAKVAIAGSRLLSWSVQNEEVDVTTGADGAWRHLLSGAGKRSIEAVVAGLHVGDAGELRLREYAISAAACDCELALDGEMTVSGPFVVSRFRVEAIFEEEATYEAVLISAGPVSVS